MDDSINLNDINQEMGDNLNETILNWEHRLFVGYLSLDGTLRTYPFSNKQKSPVRKSIEQLCESTHPTGVVTCMT